MERLKRGNLRKDQIKIAKSKKRKKIIISFVFFLILTLAVIVIINIKNTSYNAFQVSNSTNLSYLTSSRIASYRKGIVKANRDGSEAIAADGRQIWNVSYDMKEPIIDVSNSFAVIGDLGGKTAYIVNGSGVTNAITTLYPIVDVQVAAQGVAALVLNNGDRDYINLYTMESSTEIVSVKTMAAKDGFPIDIALSEDGRKLVTSYIKADGDSVLSQVTFHNFGGVGQNYHDRLVSSQTFSEFVPKVEFITNEIVAIFQDNGCWLYEMEEIPSEIAKINFDQRIKDIFYQQGYLGFVVEGKDTTASSTLLMYNLEGKIMAEEQIDFAYESIAAGEDYLILYTDETCHVYRKDGKKVFSDSFDLKVNHLFPGPTSREFLIITDISMGTIKMIETKEE